MQKRREQSLVLFAAFFVFACLLLSGGSRLIGSAHGENAIADRPLPQVRAVFSGAPVPRAETGASAQRNETLQRRDAAPAPQDHFLSIRVLSDANGNVLRNQTYLHAVYQSFVLGDGFV